MAYEGSSMKSTKPNSKVKTRRNTRTKTGVDTYAKHGENVIIADIAGVTTDHVSRVRRGTRQNLKIALLTKMLPPKLAYLKSELSKEVEKLIEL